MVGDLLVRPARAGDPVAEVISEAVAAAPNSGAPQLFLEGDPGYYGAPARSG